MADILRTPLFHHLRAEPSSHVLHFRNGKLVRSGRGASFWFQPLAAGISVELIRARAGQLPILGVCLGHQAIVAAFGGRIVHAHRLMHGKTSLIRHDDRGVFAGLDKPVEVGRYHSLTAEPAGLPDNLTVTAHTDQGEIMGVRDAALCVEGVQFHPESVLTPEGPAMRRVCVDGPVFDGDSVYPK